VLESQPLLRFALEPVGEAGQFVYRVPFAVAAGLLAVCILWWLKSLPYTHSAEERLQEALDSQPAAMPARSVA